MISFCISLGRGFGIGIGTWGYREFRHGWNELELISPAVLPIRLIYIPIMFCLFCCSMMLAEPTEPNWNGWSVGCECWNSWWCGWMTYTSDMPHTHSTAQPYYYFPLIFSAEDDKYNVDWIYATHPDRISFPTQQSGYSEWWLLLEQLQARRNTNPTMLNENSRIYSNETS